MKPISDFMRSDHMMIDAMLDEFRAAKDAPSRKKLFAVFRKEMKRHVKLEEGVLFPLFEEKTGTGSMNKSTSTLRKDHRQIAKLLEDMKQAVSKKVKTSKLEEKLAKMIGEHEKTEFNIVYPWLDEAIGEKEAAKLVASVRNNSN